MPSERALTTSWRVILVKVSWTTRNPLKIDLKKSKLTLRDIQKYKIFFNKRHSLNYKGYRIFIYCEFPQGLRLSNGIVTRFLRHPWKESIDFDNVEKWQIIVLFKTIKKRFRKFRTMILPSFCVGVRFPLSLMVFP